MLWTISALSNKAQLKTFITRAEEEHQFHPTVVWKRWQPVQLRRGGHPWDATSPLKLAARSRQHGFCRIKSFCSTWRKFNLLFLVSAGDILPLLNRNWTLDVKTYVYCFLKYTLQITTSFNHHFNLLYLIELRHLSSAVWQNLARSLRRALVWEPTAEKLPATWIPEATCSWNCKSSLEPPTSIRGKYRSACFCFCHREKIFAFVAEEKRKRKKGFLKPASIDFKKSEEHSEHQQTKSSNLNPWEDIPWQVSQPFKQGAAKCSQPRTVAMCYLTTRQSLCFWLEFWTDTTAAQM